MNEWVDADESFFSANAEAEKIQRRLLGGKSTSKEPYQNCLRYFV